MLEWKAEQDLQDISKDVKRDGTPRIVQRWVPDPETWGLCRQAWEMRVNGASYRQIHEATRLMGSIGCYTM